MTRKRMWRVCYNPHSNDWNKAPEYIAVPYDIVGESKSGKAYIVERAGWHGKKYQHMLPKREFFFTKEEAERSAREKGRI